MFASSRLLVSANTPPSTSCRTISRCRRLLTRLRTSFELSLAFSSPVQVISGPISSLICGNDLKRDLISRTGEASSQSCDFTLATPPGKWVGHTIDADRVPFYFSAAFRNVIAIRHVGLCGTLMKALLLCHYSLRRQTLHGLQKISPEKNSASFQVGRHL
jgi:hypothetical protein